MIGVLLKKMRYCGIPGVERPANACDAAHRVGMHGVYRVVGAVLDLNASVEMPAVNYGSGFEGSNHD